MAEIAMETMLQYKLARTFAETIVGDGSTTLTLTPAQIDEILAALEGRNSGAAQSVRLLIELTQNGLPEEVPAGQGADVVPLRSVS